MMDKLKQSEKINMKDVLLQREQNRKEKIKNIKEEKDLNSPDQTKLFHDTFDEHAQEIIEHLKIIEEKKVDIKALPEHFITIRKDLQVLNRYLSESTVFLKHYSVRKSLNTIEDIEAKCKHLENELMPRKKFGFKAREAKVTDNKSKKVMDEVDGDVNKIVAVPTTVFCGFCDKKDETLKLESDILEKNDIELKDLTNCTVLLFGNPSTVHISNVKYCKVLSGPVSTSVFVENANNCDLVIACQQLRIHSTTDTRFYVHITSRSIIEDSTKVKFAPYNLNYEGIVKHFMSSGLDQCKNNWKLIDDFNWLASDRPSPNWDVIEEADRVQNWC